MLIAVPLATFFQIRSDLLRRQVSIMVAAIAGHDMPAFDLGSVWMVAIDHVLKGGEIIGCGLALFEARS